MPRGSWNRVHRRASLDVEDSSDQYSYAGSRSSVMI
jgi:hypothetical protein